MAPGKYRNLHRRTLRLVVSPGKLWQRVPKEGKKGHRAVRESTGILDFEGLIPMAKTLETGGGSLNLRKKKEEWISNKKRSRQKVKKTAAAVNNEGVRDLLE